MVKTALVCGAGGFIGSHLVRRLKREGFWVRGVDLKFAEYGDTEADDFVVGDLRRQEVCERVIDRRFDVPDGTGDGRMGARPEGSAAFR